jgi:hypothetical protein
MVYIDNSEIINVTSANYTILSAYCCDEDYNISITAVNSCGLEGQPSNVTISAFNDLKVLERNSVCGDNASESTKTNNGKRHK